MPVPAVSEALSRATDDAIAGRRGALFELLARGSHLPGLRANDALAEVFAQLCRGHGSAVDGVARAMARLSADEAPAGSALEFLPLCGIAAIGARAAADPENRGSLVAELHAHADDTRFRVRVAVAGALRRVGEAAGDALLASAASWMDGYFHAAAVLDALAHETWLSRVHDGAAAVRRLDEAFDLARHAPRAAARYPGRKALVEALGRTSIAIAIRFGPPVFDALVGWTSTEDPELREVIRKILEDRRLASRFGVDVQRVHRSLEASRPPPRNPDHDVGPTRDRSGRGKRRLGRAR